ncbi:MAG: peroxiredoxin [Alphaproteobacteria bacterium]|nr:peroxiredoxin [Alphaproteobacteria bacterium]
MINIGDTLPNPTVTIVGPDGADSKKLHDILGKKTVLFAVPGAFTPTCAVKHVPSFLKNEQALKSKGIDKIICLAVNDIFVMQAWEKNQNSKDHITMLADGSGLLTEQLGLVFDLTSQGLGKRSQRYAMVLDGAKITHLWVEEPGAYKVSGAEYVISQL